MNVSRLNERLKPHRGFLIYAALNYFDKFLVFSIPLIMLYLFADKLFYNSVEYIYSVAAIAGVFIELGIRSYFLYAYKSTHDKVYFIEKVHTYFHGLFFFYVIVSAAAVLIRINMPGTGMYSLYVAIRLLFSLYIAFYSTYYLLKNVPSNIFIISIGANLLTVIILYVSKNINQSLSLEVFFVMQLAVVLYGFNKSIFCLRFLNYRECIRFIQDSLVYSWPILLNVILFMITNNYGKIYAYNFLSQEEMYQLSFIQRISLIIQLTHSSFTGYLVKDIFLDNEKAMNMKIFKIYIFTLLIVTVGIFFMIGLMNMVLPHYSVNIDMAGVFLILYTLTWCLVAFFELYINKLNKNKMILVFSGVAALVYILLLWLDLFSPLMNIALSMFCGMATNLLLELIFLRSNKLKFI